MPHRKKELRDALLELSAGIDNVRASFAHKDFPIDTFKQFAEYMPVIIWVADSGGEIIYYSRKFYEYAGRHTATCWDLMHPDDRPLVERAWNACIEEGQHYERAVRLRDIGGEYRWHKERAVPVKDGRGLISHWLGMSVDLQGVLDRGELWGDRAA